MNSKNIQKPPIIIENHGIHDKYIFSQRRKNLLKMLQPCNRELGCFSAITNSFEIYTKTYAINVSVIASA